MEFDDNYLFCDFDVFFVVVFTFCYAFNSNRKKRMRQLQKKIKTGTLNLNQDDPFELFVAATSIRYCYYNETHKILGNTFGMCVLQVRFSSLISVCSSDC